MVNPVGKILGEYRPKNPALCVCGHSHISWVGDLGINNDKEAYQRINDCEVCGCERWRPKR